VPEARPRRSAVSTSPDQVVASNPTSQLPDAQSRPSRSRRRRRYAAAGAALVVLVGAVIATVASGAIVPARRSGPLAADSVDPTSLQTVTRRDLSSETEVNASLGYAESYTVVDQGGGLTAPGSSPQTNGSSDTYTMLPAVGQVISQGQTLYVVNGNPVILLYGTTPSYRSLSEGMTGSDVHELNVDLVALGYATTSDRDPSSSTFSSETARALEKLQAHLGVTPNGTLALGQAAFLPTPVRVISVSATLGGLAQVGTPVVEATSTARQVSIALDASDQSEVAVGDHVTITLPNDLTTPGVISSVGTVASTPSSADSGSASTSPSGSSSSTPTITVLVNPTDPSETGSWDQAPVSVTITTGAVSNALVVPVDALLARSNGGYAVEVAGTGGLRHLVTVNLGLFDDADGLVQVTGAGLKAGEQVVVPNL
jgi:hypothetical protein